MPWRIREGRGVRLVANNNTHVGRAGLGLGQQLLPLGTRTAQLRQARLLLLDLLLSPFSHGRDRSRCCRDTTLDIDRVQQVDACGRHVAGVEVQRITTGYYRSV